jgi:hypothetical protein
MTDADDPGSEEPQANNLFGLLSIERVLLLIKGLSALGIVLHLAYFVAATLVHRNGIAASISRLGTAACGIAWSFISYGMAIVIDRFRKR